MRVHTGAASSFDQKDHGVRLIAVGEIGRRLKSKEVFFLIKLQANTFLSRNQVDVGVVAGAGEEAMSDSTVPIVASNSDDTNLTCLQKDFKIPPSI